MSFLYVLSAQFSSFHVLRTIASRARPFSSTIVEWMLFLWLCSRQRRPVIRGDSIFPVHPPRTTARVLIIIKSLTNRGSAPQTIQFLSSSFFPFLFSSFFPFLSLSRACVRPFSCIFSSLLFPPPFCFTSVLSVSLSVYGPNRFPSQLATAN